MDGHATFNNGQISNTLNNTQFEQNKITVWFFPPSIIPDQVRRSQQFEFDESVKYGLDRLAQDKDKDMTEVDSDVGILLANSRSPITYTQNGELLHSSILSDRWSFIIVMDSMQRAPGLGQFAHSESREMFTGFCMDEPIDPRSRYMSSPILNPNAILEITHHTNLGTVNSRGSSGLRKNLVVRSDSNVVNQTTAKLISSEQENLYMTDTTRLNNAINDVTGSIGAVSIAEAAMQPNLRKNAILPSRWDNSFAHAKEITGTVVQSAQQASEGVTGSELSGFTDHLGDITSNFTNQMHQKSKFGYFPGNMAEQSLPLGQVLHLDRSGNANNDINVIVVDSTQYSNLDLADQREVNRSNIMSSVIQSSIGPIAAGFMISAISFVYDSCPCTPSISLGIPEGAWKFEHISFMADLNTDSKKKAAVNAFRNFLERNVFPHMRQNHIQGGHFKMMCHYDFSGTTAVHIQPYDFDPVHGFNIFNNKLGGLSSSLIANGQTTYNNAMELHGLLTSVSSAYDYDNSLQLRDNNPWKQGGYPMNQQVNHMASGNMSSSGPRIVSDDNNSPGPRIV